MHSCMRVHRHDKCTNKQAYSPHLSIFLKPPQKTVIRGPGRGGVMEARASGWEWFVFVCVCVGVCVCACANGSLGLKRLVWCIMLAECAERARLVLLSLRVTLSFRPSQWEHFSQRLSMQLLLHPQTFFLYMSLRCCWVHLQKCNIVHIFSCRYERGSPEALLWKTFLTICSFCQVLPFSVYSEKVKLVPWTTAAAWEWLWNETVQKLSVTSCELHSQIQ